MKARNFAFALAVGFVAAICCAAVAHADIIADSQTGFSGTEGLNGWTYRWNWNGYTGELTNAQFVANENMYGFGSMGAWESVNYDRFIKEGQHPGWASNLPVEDARRWTSTYAGAVEITGQIAKFDTTVDPLNDGVLTKILINGSQIYSYDLGGSDGVGVNFDLFANLNVGDTVDFIVNPKAHIQYDATKFTATISTAPEPSAIVLCLSGVMGLACYAWRKRGAK